MGAYRSASAVKEKRGVLKNVNKENQSEYWDDSFDCAGVGAFGCDSNLAPQQGMGLLPQRGYRTGAVDSIDFIVARQDITCQFEI